MADIMTQEHPKWSEFFKALFEKCNFIETREPGKVSWSCSTDDDNMNPLCWSTQIIDDMGGFDVLESLRHFKENGAECDCRVLFILDVDKLKKLLHKKFFV